MKKSFIMTLGLMLGLVGLVSALDRQAEITGASNYQNLSFTTSQTAIFSGDGLIEGVIVSSSALSTPSPYIIILDTATGTSGSELTRIEITTSVVLGGAAVVTVGESQIRNFQYKFITPIRVNKGLAATNSSVGFKSTILYKRLN